MGLDMRTAGVQGSVLISPRGSLSMMTPDVKRDGRRVRVFFGSTREDLAEYRDSTLTALSQLRIRIEAMELWHASPNEPLEECLQRVRCSDIYICALAFRYGTETLDGRSFTEAEFDLASQLDKDRLGFLMSEDAPICSKRIDRGESAAKVDAFRSKLKRTVHCEHFSSPSDLAQKVLLSLRELLVNKGIEVAANVDLTSFWREVQATHKVMAPEDVLIPFDNSMDELALTGKMQEQVAGLELFHSHLKETYAQLPNDLRVVLEDMGVDPAKVEGSVPARKLFEFRDWEWVTFFPNRTHTMRLALAHLKVKILERMSHGDDWGPEQERMLSEAKNELEKAVRECSVYID